MKYRNGFVSNSSSSSFVLIAPIDHPIIKQLEEGPDVDSEDYDESTYYSIETRKNEEEVIVFGKLGMHDAWFYNLINNASEIEFFSTC